LVERDEIGTCAPGAIEELAGELEADALAGVALAGGAAPRVVDEDAAHRLRRDAQEVRAPLEAPLGVLVDEPEVGLVDQRRRLERVVGRLPAHHPRGDPVELVVDDREQLVAGSRVARAQAREETRGLTCVRARHAALRFRAAPMLLLGYSLSLGTLNRTLRLMLPC